MLQLLFGMIAMPLVLCEVAVVRHQPFTPWVFVNIAIYPLITLTSIALHEAGHMLAARAVGLQVPRVQIGLGRPIARWRWAQTRLTLHALPLVGLTYVGGESPKGLKWRYWASIVSGPAVTLAIVVGTVAWHPPLEVGAIVAPSAAVASRFSAREMACFANAWLLLFNLVPLPLSRNKGWSRNDGQQLVTVPFLSARKLDMLRVAPGILDAQDLSERDDHEGARRILEVLLARFPGSWAVLNSLAVVQLDLGRLNEARSSFLALLETEPPFPEMRWTVRNNLAWADYLLRVDDLRDEANAHSEAVVGRYKQAPWAMGTRGAVLSWLGRHDEAIRFLEGAYLRNSTGSHRALNAAGLATVLARLGRTREATQWLERARSNHASCPLLVEAQAAIGAATNEREATLPDQGQQP